MEKIKAIGFDMDYTLAMYKSAVFEKLSCDGALHKLVHVLGYPQEILESTHYNHSFFIRGLVIDKERGNILKLDRHRYVKNVLHGFKELNKMEKMKVYEGSSAKVRGGGNVFQEPDFANLDTIFSIPDAFLFATLVEYKDKHPNEGVLGEKGYRDLYRDVRRSVDLCHRDGHIKDRVAENPELFIERDESLVETLVSLRKSGRKVFLLTNSLWNYTEVVMKFLCGHSERYKEEKWMDLFDLIITGSNKPAFILNGQLALYRCDTSTGLLSNTEGPVGMSAKEYLAQGKVFQGGNWLHLHQLLEIKDGTRILYVGDHIYSDVLRSKRTLGWRTMLVIPELKHEIDIMLEPETKRLAEETIKLKLRREEIEERVDRYELMLLDSEFNDSEEEDEDRQEIRRKLREAKDALQQARVTIAEATDKLNVRYHPVWGQLFKTGLQNSRFAEQVHGYACLYTSKVSNIGLVSPEMHWRTITDIMPHDRIEFTPMRRMLKRRSRQHLI